MIRLTFLSIAIFGVCITSWASTVACSNAEATLTYRSKNYEGGAPPPVGMEVGRETWRLNGTIITENVILNGLGVEPPPIAPHWDPASYQVVSKVEKNNRILTTYTQKVSLLKKGKEIVVPETQVLCELNTFKIPPP